MSLCRSGGPAVSFCGLAFLTRLTVRSFYLAGSAVVDLRGLSTRLKHLCVKGGMEVSGGYLSRLTHLETLSVYRLNCSGWAAFPHLHRLEVGMFDAASCRSLVEWVNSMPQLETLEVHVFHMEIYSEVCGLRLPRCVRVCCLFVQVWLLLEYMGVAFVRWYIRA